MKLELSIHASNLKNVAGLGKGTSDPFAVVTHIATTTASKPAVVGKTEVIKNTLDPQWVKVFLLDYELGTPMKVVVSIFDEVRKGDNISMGSAVFDISELLGARGNTKAKRLKSAGTIFAHVRKSEGTGLLRLTMSGIKLKNTEGFLKKSDPFFELSRRADVAGSLTWDNVYRSKKVKNNLSPVWDDATIQISLLCGGNLDKPVLVKVYDHESNGKHVLMGQFETSVNGLVRSGNSHTEIKLKKTGKETGTIVVKKAEVAGIQDLTSRIAAVQVSPPPPSVPSPTVAYVPATAIVVPPVAQSARSDQPTFVDYVIGGCDLQVAVAIDFTGSNGDPRKPGTLHYHHKDGQKNDYEKAISSIVHTLAQYDTDSMFPVWGFGAKYGGILRHVFQCGPQAEVHGVDGVLHAYHDVFKSGIVMSGPTVFTEVIQTAATRATSAQDEAQQRGQQAYTILLILTDGSVSDVNATAAALDQASDAPLSVVIIGIGNADFSGMHFLDNSSKPGKRDIAQFVQFSRHSGNSVDLTSETLREIPDQLVGYFQSKGISPLPPMVKSNSILSIGAAEEEIDLSLDFGASGGDDGEIVVAAGGVDNTYSNWA